jgi:hypothetical protein
MLYHTPILSPFWLNAGPRVLRQRRCIWWTAAAARLLGTSIWATGTKGRPASGMPCMSHRSYITKSQKVAQLGLRLPLMKPTLLHCFLQPPPSLFCLWTGTHPAMQLAAASTAVAGGLAEGGFPVERAKAPQGFHRLSCARRCFRAGGGACRPRASLLRAPPSREA